MSYVELSVHTFSLHPPLFFPSVPSVLNSSSQGGRMLIYSGQDSSLGVSLLVRLAFCHSLTASGNHSEDTCIFSPSFSQPFQPPLTTCTKGCLWSRAWSRALDCRKAPGISMLLTGQAMDDLSELTPTRVMSCGHLLTRLDQSQQLISHESLRGPRQECL